MVDEVKAIYLQMIDFDLKHLPIITEDHCINRVINKYQISLLSVSAGREFSQEVLERMISTDS